MLNPKSKFISSCLCYNNHSKNYRERKMSDTQFKEFEEAMTGAIATKNKKGFMFKELSEISKQYLEYSKSCNRVLEIGCAYGISVLPILNLEKVTVHAVDLSDDHLKILKSKLTPNQNYYFMPTIGEFPVNTHYENYFFDAIHISNVLHFIRGENFNLALEKCFNWLKPHGKIFINTCALYLPYFTDFISTYENRKKAGIKWPGEIENLKDFIPKDASKAQIDAEPDFIHVFIKEDLEHHFKHAGFTIEQSLYFTLENADYLKYADDTKSMVGLIAKKP